MKINGYDYAFALSVTVVNEILKANLSGKNIPVKYHTVDANSGTTVNVDLSLAPWKIVPGGSGTLINVELPVKQGFLSISGGVLPSNSYDLKGISVVVQIELKWLGAGDQQQASGGAKANRLAFSPTGPKKSTHGNVAAVTVLDPHKRLDTIGKGILSATLVQGLADNKSNLQYVFASVDPTPAKLASWLNPVKWQYYYVHTDAGASALCFLAMLSDKPFPPQPTFDAQNLDAHDNALLLVAQDMLFKNVILPAIEKSFPNAKFKMSVNHEGAATIANSGNFDIGKATAKSFKVTTSNSGDGLAMHVSGGGPLKFLFGLADLPDADYTWGVSTVNPLKYKNGTVQFKSDPNPVNTHDQSIPWYDYIILVGTGIANIAFAISDIVDKVKNYYDGSKSTGLAKINDELQASLDGNVVNLANLVSWSKPGETFQPTAAGLDLAFYVRGNLRI